MTPSWQTQVALSSLELLVVSTDSADSCICWAERNAVQIRLVPAAALSLIISGTAGLGLQEDEDRHAVKDASGQEGGMREGHLAARAHRSRMGWPEQCQPDRKRMSLQLRAG